MSDEKAYLLESHLGKHPSHDLCPSMDAALGMANTDMMVRIFADDSCPRIDPQTKEHIRSLLIWLCMSGVKLFPQWRQAVAFFPVIEPSGFLATVEPRSAFAQVTQRVAL